jgi:hypothetical protein
VAVLDQRAVLEAPEAGLLLERIEPAHRAGQPEHIPLAARRAGLVLEAAAIRLGPVLADEIEAEGAVSGDARLEEDLEVRAAAQRLGAVGQRRPLVGIDGPDQRPMLDRLLGQIVRRQDEDRLSSPVGCTAEAEATSDGGCSASDRPSSSRSGPTSWYRCARPAAARHASPAAPDQEV